MKRVALTGRFYRRSNKAQIHILTRRHSKVETLDLAENPAETGLPGCVTFRLHFSVEITTAGKLLGGVDQSVDSRPMARMIQLKIEFEGVHQYRNLAVNRRIFVGKAVGWTLQARMQPLDLQRSQLKQSHQQPVIRQIMNILP